MAYQYKTVEELQEAVRQSTTWTDVARYFGKSPVGGTVCHLRDRCKRAGIDFSHFTGKRHAKGRQARNKKLPDEVLVYNEDPLAVRSKPEQVGRCMQEVGIPYECDECKITEWNGQLLTLHIDHIDGCFRNNRKENLRFLCPNCHSQTATFGNRKRK